MAYLWMHSIVAPAVGGYVKSKMKNEPTNNAIADKELRSWHNRTLLMINMKRSDSWNSLPLHEQQ